MTKTLVILAAGIGSRFGGGVKQLTSVDDNGHLNLENLPLLPQNCVYRALVSVFIMLPIPVFIGSKEAAGEQQPGEHQRLVKSHPRSIIPLEKYTLSCYCVSTLANRCRRINLAGAQHKPGKNTIKACVEQVPEINSAKKRTQQECR